MTTLELTALAGHHPLSFLAACGLLRCCHEWDDFGCVKLAWKQNAGRFTAVLQCGTSLDVTMLTQMLTCRAKLLRQSIALNWSNKIDSLEKFRAAGHRLMGTAEYRKSDALAFLAALASDIVTRDEHTLRPTLLDLTSGNQQLLKSIRIFAGEATRRNGTPRTFVENEVMEAIFGPWLYRDSEHPLGWDPQTQRLHALRYKLPEQDNSNRSVRAAVFLASQALPLFPCFAVDGKLRTTSFYRDNGDDWFSWPIWRNPISLDTLRSLLAHPFTKDLRRRGVAVVYHCRRVRTGGSEGNYQIFSHAELRF